MTWDSYTGFTLLTGLAAIPMGLMPWLEARERVVGVIAGVAMVAYAMDGASRTSGIFFYHPLIFVLPFILVAYYVYQHRQHSGGQGRFGGNEAVRLRPPARHLWWIVGLTATLAMALYHAAMPATDDMSVLQGLGVVLALVGLIPLFAKPIPGDRRFAASLFFIIAGCAIAGYYIVFTDSSVLRVLAVAAYAMGWTRLRGMPGRSLWVAGAVAGFLQWVMYETGLSYNLLSDLLVSLSIGVLWPIRECLIYWVLPISAGVVVGSLVSPSSTQPTEESAALQREEA